MLHSFGQRHCGRISCFNLATPHQLETVLPATAQRRFAAQERFPMAWQRIVVEKPFATDLAIRARVDPVIYPLVNEHRSSGIDPLSSQGNGAEHFDVCPYFPSAFRRPWNRVLSAHVQITFAKAFGGRARWCI